MKIYILSDHHGLIGYYATKDLAIQAAEDIYEDVYEFAFECKDETFQDYWDGFCDLEEVTLVTEDEE